MAPRKRATKRQQLKRRLTRKVKKGKKVLDVRSKNMIANFEQLLGRGPLTLVLIYADWCGACHRFRDEVWSPLTQLKNATMNRAAIREDMIAGTSLANVERKFYPTLLLVGKDKKPATFVDENGVSTPAMPRKQTLDEDKESLTALVNSPTPLLPAVAGAAAGAAAATPDPEAENEVSEAVQEEMNLEASMNKEGTLNQPAYSIQPIESVKRQSQTPSDSIDINIEEEAEETLGRSPFNNKGYTPSIAASTRKMAPPDIGADLVASQNRGRPVLLGGSRSTGSRLLDAIKNQTRSLRAMLRLRSSTHKRR
jgi:thiol-disulfide isomerase/thioredoxin